MSANRRYHHFSVWFFDTRQTSVKKSVEKVQGQQSQGAPPFDIIFWLIAKSSTSTNFLPDLLKSFCFFLSNVWTFLCFLFTVPINSTTVISLQNQEVHAAIFLLHGKATTAWAQNVFGCCHFTKPENISAVQVIERLFQTSDRLLFRRTQAFAGLRT